MDNAQSTSAASVGGKRLAPEEEEEDGNGVVVKRARNCGAEMRRVAEIVMVLSAMAGMRAGRSPTEAEAELMAEARGKLVEICESFKPKELVGRDSIGTVIEDLGLNWKVKDQRLGFRAARMSIKDKVLFAKRKMEDSKKFSLPSAGYTSQTSQAGFSAASEHRGPSHRMFSSDKPNNAPLPSGGLPAPSTGGHVSASTSMSVPYQPPSTEAKASTVSSGLGMPASTLQRVDKKQFKVEGGPNGTSFTPQVQANASANNATVNAPAWSIQPHSASLTKTPPENKVLNPNPPKIEGTADLSMPRTALQAARDQTFRPFITQAASASLPAVHQPAQGMKYVQPSPVINNHNEIAKIVQKLLQPKLPEHPTWNPPSREYMNKALTCQMCKLIVNEVETVVLCDACEKGYHLKCLESINQKGIPNGEWHCVRCIALSNGKPFPPKYGRVMRSITPPTKAPSNPAGGQSTSEKKARTLDPKPNQQNITMNGNSSLQNPTVSGNVESTLVESTPCAKEASENSIASSGTYVNLRTDAGTIPNNQEKSSEAVCDFPSVGSPGERTTQPTKVSKLPAVEYRLMSRSKLQPPAMLSDSTGSISEHSQPSNNSQDIGQTEQSNSAEVPLTSCPDHPVVEESESIRGATYSTSGTVVKEIKQEGAQANVIGSSKINNGARNDAGLSSNGLRGVVWIGNILKVVDGKKFYESCFIDGATYKVQDYALFRSIHDKLVPYKLQAMWEDIKNGLKWVTINQCYFPGDLPEAVGRPCSPETNEVYESNHESSVMAGLIQGPCEVLPPTKFKENSERQILLGTETNDGSLPVFLCKWFYDELKGSFQPVFS